MKELTQPELKNIEGGSWIGDLVRKVDDLFDVADNLQNDGSNRPFKKYENL